MTISRAQYEVVIIVVDKNGTNSEFFQKLSQNSSPQKKDNESLFKQFLDSSTESIDIFEPQDTYTQNYGFLRENLEKESGNEMIMKKPASITLQLTMIYPRHFHFLSSTTLAGKNKTISGVFAF